MVFTFTYNSPCSWIKIYAVCYYLHRDALAKEIYTQLFGWLISKVNNIIFKGKMQMSIAVLDIFGFEVSYVLRCKTCFDCWEAPLRDPFVGSIFLSCCLYDQDAMMWILFKNILIYPWYWKDLFIEQLLGHHLCLPTAQYNNCLCFFHICLNSWTAKW